MKRRDFVKTAASTLGFLSSYSIHDFFQSNASDLPGIVDIKSLSNIESKQANDFSNFLDWLEENGWVDFLKNIITIPEFDLTKNEILISLIPNVNEFSGIHGLDDFGGNKLIEPGNPSFSLLYHILASPRIKSSFIKAYPTFCELDILEDYIYALKPFNDYFHDIDNDNLHLMVLAYEYRPAFKTPTFDPNSDFNKFAQLVFSRTGIARIGNKAINYDSENRCFTNLPKENNQEKQIAVTPSRYCLFIVELVEVNQENKDFIKVMNYQDDESTNLGNRYFIRPLRKLFNDTKIEIEYAEYHKNEKLHQLSQFEIDQTKFAFPSGMNFFSAPFIRISNTNDKRDKLCRHATDLDMVSLQKVKSSVLLSSFPSDLVRWAEQNGKPIYFNVPPFWEENRVSNRRYNAFKVTTKKSKEVNDAIWTDFIYRRDRRTSRFRAPKNAPLFVNVKYKLPVDSTQQGVLISNANLESEISKGKYFAQLFEDSICDGCISAKVTVVNNTVKNSLDNILLTMLNKNILPAFSLVTAPDFFPYIDSNDIRAYYFRNRFKVDSNFLEGGSINLSGIRQRANPYLLDPYTGRKAFHDNFKSDKSFDTITAVVSINDKPLVNIEDNFKTNYLRDYSASSYLPDTGTGIFFPGWDATYSTEANVGIQNPFLATIGLGSPFPEDMKLCAAANGMWPIASPDAGRTFQGSLESFPSLGKPSTSIPLMDLELGLHENSPHVKFYRQSSSYGWDGEQGPFLMIEQSSGKLYVNFTDIGRADYISNLLTPSIGFDMSQLRGLDAKHVINRMDCLRDAIRKISGSKLNKAPEVTKYWLICSEIVNNWSNGANAYGIPPGIIGANNNWAKDSSGLNGKGFLFIFVVTQERDISLELESHNSKRRKQLVREIAVCKVESQGPDYPSSVKWATFNVRTLPLKSSIVKWKS